ncbi:MAG TPA: hypothetical protein VEX13_05690, partial [Chloroflexia bacterium]|nr:hypothetical protein [Chloroflexia bacterium]
MGRLSTSTYILSTLGVIACGILIWWSVNEKHELVTIISNVGSVASFFGLFIAIIQIESVRHTTEQIKKATLETKGELIRSVS